jgi:hypothetical protein
MGFYLPNCCNNLAKTAYIIDSHPFVLKMVVDAPLINVAQWQKTDNPVLVPQVVHFGVGCKVGYEVPV